MKTIEIEFEINEVVQVMPLPSNTTGKVNAIWIDTQKVQYRVAYISGMNTLVTDWFDANELKATA